MPLIEMQKFCSQIKHLIPQNHGFKLIKDVKQMVKMTQDKMLQKHVIIHVVYVLVDREHHA